jgi:hypothetical protein
LGACPDPVRADAIESQLLTEATMFHFQSGYSQLPVNSPVRVTTHLDPEALLLLSERKGTEHSSTVEANGNVIFYRSSQGDEAKIFAARGDQIHMHTHPGTNEVVPSPEDLVAALMSQTDMMIVSRRADGGVASMTYTPTEAQELSDLLQNGDTRGFLNKFHARYQAEGLGIGGTTLEENMKLQGMIP